MTVDTKLVYLRYADIRKSVYITGGCRNLFSNARGIISKLSSDLDGDSKKVSLNLLKKF